MLEVPTLEQVRERLANDYELNYAQSQIVVDAHTRGTGHTEKVNAFAALAYGLRLKQREIAEQFFVRTMNEENLSRRGNELGVNRIPPAFAQGNVRISSTGAGFGSITLPAGTVLANATNLRYRTVSEITITEAAGFADVDVVALETGSNSNDVVGATLQIDLGTAGPIFLPEFSNVDTNAILNTAMVGGAEIEDLERYRARVAERIQLPPMGGAPHDYVAWAKAASVDVADVIVSPHENAVGEIVLRFVTTGSNLIPTPTQIATVDAYVRPLKPVEANLTVAAPTLQNLNLTFTSLTPNTADVQAAVLAEIEDFLDRQSRSDTTIYLSQLRAAIARAPGLVDFNITLNTNVAVPISNYIVIGTTNFPG